MKTKITVNLNFPAKEISEITLKRLNEYPYFRGTIEGATSYMGKFLSDIIHEPFDFEFLVRFLSIQARILEIAKKEEDSQIE